MNKLKYVFVRIMLFLFTTIISCAFVMLILSYILDMRLLQNKRKYIYESVDFDLVSANIRFTKEVYSSDIQLLIFGEFSGELKNKEILKHNNNAMIVIKVRIRDNHEAFLEDCVGRIYLYDYIENNSNTFVAECDTVNDNVLLSNKQPEVSFSLEYYL